MNEFYLKTPLAEFDIKKLKTEDVVFLSGKIFTARDKAHKMILNYLEEMKKLPFNLKDSIIFHAGPLTKIEDETVKIVSIGPTTSFRMNLYIPELLNEFQLKAIIGKGGIDEKIIKNSKSPCIYLAMTGGIGALTIDKIKGIDNIYWENELGYAEAVYELVVENFGPLIVAIDSRGNSLY